MLPEKKTPPKTNLADLTILLYGNQKIGKSTWCSHAEGALFLATEPGLNSLEVFQVPIDNWPKFLEVCGNIATGKHKFKTIIVDTVDNLYRMVCQHICGKFNIEHESDLGYGKGWALVNNEFQRAINKLAFLPYGLYLVSHAKEIEIDTRTGGHIKTVPSLPDKARQIVLGLADLILFCTMEVEKTEEGQAKEKRVIRTKPSLYYEAGDRTGKLPETIDLNYSEFIKAFRTKEK